MRKNTWWDDYGFAVAVGAAILFFIFLLIKSRNKTVADQESYELDVPWPTGQSNRREKKKFHVNKKYEKRCREIFESVFHKPFPTIRPGFLRHSTGRCLELDGYNDELKLAFEYQGRQHAEYIPGLFHRSELDFKKQQLRDNEKRRMCKLAGVTLIEIPHTVRFEKLEPYIRTAISSSSI